MHHSRVAQPEVLAVALYQHHILPRLIDLAMRNPEVTAFRRQLVPLATGRVLEIGVGSGLNLPFYGGRVERVIGLDPSPELLALAESRAGRAGLPALEALQASAEDIPLPAHSADTVVSTWSLCSIADLPRALGEIRRVLKPDGRLLFVEHGHAPDPGVARWQRRLTPLWRPLAGGCHLDRKMDDLVAAAGFRLESLTTGYARGPRFLTYMYQGCALPSV